MVSAEEQLRHSGIHARIWPTPTSSRSELATAQLMIRVANEQSAMI